MKKLWNLMLVALVMLGAAACTENNDSVDVKAEGLSFYAEITNDATRADLAYDEETKMWNTVWEGNETIVVKDAASKAYNFVNSQAEPSKFTCTEEGVGELLGKSVNISIANAEQSKAGKSGLTVSLDVESFDNTKTILLEATNSFLRYTYNGDGKVALTLTYEGGQAFVYNEGQAFDTIEFEGVKGENWVSFNAPAEKTEAQLSYSINGVECKHAAIKIHAGKIYNLGTLAMPYEASAYSVVGTHNNWTAGKTPMYIVGDYAVAYDVVFSGAENKFKVLGNDKWLSSNNLTLNTWTKLSTGAEDIAIAAGTYDIYFNEARTMLCVVEAGATVPELPVIEPIVWSLAGSFNSWGDTLMVATDAANLFVAKGVELKSGDEIKVKDSKSWETSYGGGINNLEANKWMKAYLNGSNVVVAKSGSYDVYFEYAEGAEYSKLYLVEADGDYTAAVEQTANGTLVPDGGDEPDQPVVTPGVASEWALVGVFSSWADKTMLTTSDANVVVLQSVTMKAAEGFLVRKPSTEWNDKHGAGNINYLKTNHYITTSKGGADMCLEADGTYDIYFNTSTKVIYIMAAGVDYTTATKQTVNGEEPKQEEPEVTEKVVYLKPNSNWTQSNARFAAYFFGGATGEKWVSMTAVGDGTYEAHLPEGYDYGCNIIFCRMNPSTTANNWNNKWNQTSDLKTPTDGKNLYTVKSGTWDKGGGTWSVK